MNTFQITKIGIEEAQQLQKIGKQTFYETFSKNNTEENMQSYLDKAFALDTIITELTDVNSEFYFAKLEDAIIGYLKLNFGQSQTELKEEKALEIERIYVLAAYHGQKVGQLLYNKAIEIAKAKKVNYVWLGVWEENLRAINFYKKNGFIAFDKHVFKLGEDEQMDIMMKLTLINHEHSK